MTSWVIFSNIPEAATKSYIYRFYDSRRFCCGYFIMLTHPLKPLSLAVLYTPV